MAIVALTFNTFATTFAILLTDNDIVDKDELKFYLLHSMFVKFGLSH
jgi:hypothetical protein